MQSKTKISSDDEIEQLEKALFRASKIHHRCVGGAIEKFLNRETGYNDVTDHCLDSKRKVDQILKDLKQYHIKKDLWLLEIIFSYKLKELLLLYLYYQKKSQ